MKEACFYSHQLRPPVSATYSCNYGASKRCALTLDGKGGTAVCMHASKVYTVQNDCVSDTHNTAEGFVKFRSNVCENHAAILASFAFEQQAACADGAKKMTSAPCVPINC